LSASASAFLSHWKSLRSDAALVPSSCDYLDRVNPALQPFVAFSDLDPLQRHTIALYGTALVEQWGKDMTGQTIQCTPANPPSMQLLENLSRCAAHPCGLWEISRFATSKGRIILREILALPLATGRTGRTRLARYHHVIEDLGEVELFTGLVETLDKQWLDIGQGRPALPPQVIAASAVRPIKT